MEYIKQIAMKKMRDWNENQIFGVHGKVQSQTLPVKKIINIDDFGFWKEKVNSRILSNSKAIGLRFPSNFSVLIHT